LHLGTATLVSGEAQILCLERIKVNGRESSPGWRKSRCFAPDQSECRFLAIRCGIGQESYNRGKNVSRGT